MGVSTGQSQTASGGGTSTPSSSSSASSSSQQQQIQQQQQQLLQLQQQQQQQQQQQKQIEQTLHIIKKAAKKQQLKRVPGRFYRGIIYGNTATFQGKLADPLHTHRWSLFVRGRHGEDISTYISKVVFSLHDSFENHTRTVSSPPYEVHETGWGEFEVLVNIHFKDFGHPEHNSNSNNSNQSNSGSSNANESSSSHGRSSSNKNHRKQSSTSIDYDDGAGSSSSSSSSAGGSERAQDPIVLSHMLRLYPSDDTVTVDKRTIACEQYEVCYLSYR